MQFIPSTHPFYLETATNWWAPYHDLPRPFAISSGLTEEEWKRVRCQSWRHHRLPPTEWNQVRCARTKMARRWFSENGRSTQMEAGEINVPVSRHRQSDSWPETRPARRPCSVQPVRSRLLHPSPISSTKLHRRCQPLSTRTEGHAPRCGDHCTSADVFQDNA